MRASKIIGGVVAVVVLSLAALSIVRLMSEQPGTGVSRELPRQNQLWFLEPLLPFLGAQPSAKMQPVEVELQTVEKKIIKLRIPRAYISAGEQAKDGYSGWVNLVVYLPGYLPNVLAAKAGYEMYGKNGLRSPSEVSINVKPYGRNLTGKLIEGVKQRMMRGSAYDGKFEQYNHIRRVGGENYPDRNSGYFIPIARNDVLIGFAASPKTGELTGCRMTFDFNDDITLEVSFSAKHLDQYETIKKAVIELMVPFVLPSDDSPR